MYVSRLEDRSEFGVPFVADFAEQQPATVVASYAGRRRPRFADTDAQAAIGFGALDASLRPDKGSEP